jgi:IMP dehydrogenase
VCLIIRKGLSYDDVLLVPKRTRLRSRSHVDLRTKLTKNIRLNVPLVSANMDTVTEHKLAIALALHGGIGVIHQFMSKLDQASEVRKVKRSMNNIIDTPYSVPETNTLKDALDLMETKQISGILVVNSNFKLSGILTSRDLLFQEDLTKTVAEVMTSREKLITGSKTTTVEDAKKIFKQQKIEKLPLVDGEDRIVGLITLADMKKQELYPSALRDEGGRLMVAAAVGVKSGFLERAEMLLEAGADVIVVDIAHGHSDLAINTITEIKSHFPNAEILAGNIATGDAARELIEAGADGLKIGVGPGASCKTRVVAGAGVPQITAIIDCFKVAREYNIPICADGGLKESGDIAKAVAAGAHSIMSGAFFAGTAETPGRIILRDGRRFKQYRGSASVAANISRKMREKNNTKISDYIPEGVEMYKPYKGPVSETIKYLLGGLRSGMSYCGASNVEECHKNAEFIEMTSMGYKESRPHGLSNQSY